jgi:hypothetical protein
MDSTHNYNNRLNKQFKRQQTKMNTDKEIISRLKFIGRIKKNEKINTQHMYIQPCGILTAINRTIFQQDNRNNTMNFVQKTVEDSFNLLDKYREDEDFLMSGHIIDDLLSSKVGLESLKETYVTDLKFCCDIDTLLQLISSRLNNSEDVN